VRRRLFAHLTEHSPAYFADRLPGQLAGRITATSNAIYEVESRFAWNVLPPTLAVIFAIVLLSGISLTMAAALVGVSLALGAILVRLAAGGRKLHQQYATEAAAVDGELVDVIT